MSLLLDALQRASQEKEKLAEARASADKPSQTIELAPAPLPPLAIDFAPLASPAPDPIADQDLSPESQTVSTPSGLAAVETTEPAELTLDPMKESTTETSPSPVIPSLVRSAPDSPAGPAVAKPARQAAHPSPVMSPQVAREILGATAKAAKQGPNRRLIALGVVALLIAAANAAFFLGFMDKFLGISSSGLAPVVPPAPLAAPPLPPSAPTSAAVSEAQGGSESRASPDVRADAGGTPSAPIATRVTNSSPRATSPRDDVSVPTPRSEARVVSARETLNKYQTP